VLLLWTYMQLQAHVCRETLCRSDSKERLDKFCIPRQVVRYLPFGFIKKYVGNAAVPRTQGTQI